MESARLEGDLTLASTPALYLRADALIGSSVLDLSRVTRADSAGLALLLELSRRARRRGHSLTLRAAPAQLQALAAFFGLTKLLSFEA